MSAGRRPVGAEDRLHNRQLVLVATLVATFLAAIDIAVVGTAMPTVVANLGGLQLYSWVFTAYLVTSTVTLPIYGKLADLHGRKRVFIGGTAIFVAGSALCGTAQSMEQLILFRAIQGIGAGAVQPVTLTIIGDLFDLAERARLMGVYSALWGIAGLSGPAIGGFITDQWHWRWVFYLNLPFGLAAIALVWLALNERLERRENAIDVAGATLLIGAIALVLLASLEGSESLAPPGWLRLLLLAGAAVLVLLFVRQEQRAAEPLVPLQLFRSRLIATSSLASLMVGVPMFGFSTMVAPFVQGVIGTNATTAGMVVACVSLGWLPGSVLAGRLILRWGYRPTAVLGMALLVAGTALLTLLRPDSPLLQAAVTMALAGLGFGLSNTPLILSVQNAVPWHLRGVATSSTQLTRVIGGVLGLSAAGALFAASVSGGLAGLGGAVDPNLLLRPELRQTLPAEVLPRLIAVLEQGLRRAYLLILGIAILGLLASACIPGGPADEYSWKDGGAGAARG